MSNQFWQLWLIRNYEWKEASYVSYDEMCERAKEVGEPSMLLGLFIRDIWGEDVKKVRLNNNTHTYYENLGLRNEVGSNLDINDCALDAIDTPTGWTRLHNDSGSTIFVRSQGGHIVEMHIEKGPCDEVNRNIKLRCHNLDIDVVKEPLFTPLAGLSLRRKVEILLKFIETSRICDGIALREGEEILTLGSHIIHTENIIGYGKKTVAYSLKCKMFSNSSRCSSCILLNRDNERRMSRKHGKEVVNEKTNKRYMSKDELQIQLNDQKRLRINAEKRDMYWKDKFDEELIEMEGKDHNDLENIMKEVDEKGEIPENFACLWEQQKTILKTKHKCAYRWHPKIIRLCLDLYCKNPHVLDPLREFITLPSNRTIRLYKNKVEQSPGWKQDILRWCKTEANRAGLKEDGYWGGFVIDEMKIQEDLEMAIKNGKHRLVGVINLGEGHESMEQILGKAEPRLASQVLQFIFLSDQGFRFPIAQFPSGDCTPSTLYMLFWEGVMKMQEKGFVIYWCVLYGADCNRQFIKIHFQDKSPEEEHFVTTNFSSGNPMVFLMDPKHNIKKTRNNIQKSNEQVKPRCLKINGKSVTWRQFMDAYNWDQKNCSLPIHERLTQDHFMLDSALKMRNHLAEDVLDQKMLYLMQKYQESLSATGRDAKMLDSVLLLLQHTTHIISLFTDKLPIVSKTDVRLKKLQAFYSFMSEWRRETEDNNKHFVSSKLWFDLQSMCIGFQSVVAIKLAKFPHAVIKPAIINQDCVENHFCQVRACNGQNNNPTYFKQECTQNSIRFGQSTISAKSNAGLKRDNTAKKQKELHSCSMFQPKKKKPKKEKQEEQHDLLKKE